RLSIERWITALNATLPGTIRILRGRFVSPKFHARFSAKGKVYRYRISNGAVLSPFDLDRTWHVASPLNGTLLKRAAKLFVGRLEKPERNAAHFVAPASGLYLVRVTY